MLRDRARQVQCLTLPLPKSSSYDNVSHVQSQNDSINTHNPVIFYIFLIILQVNSSKKTKQKKKQRGCCCFQIRKSELMGLPNIFQFIDLVVHFTIFVSLFSSLFQYSVHTVVVSKNVFSQMILHSAIDCQWQNVSGNHSTHSSI